MAERQAYTQADLEGYLEVAIKAANAAGQLVKERIHSADKHVTEKSAVDLVTEVDVAAERIIINILREAFPAHAFLGEESGGDAGEAQLTNHPTWIIDPIDGTTNFVHGYPFVAVCIGLAIDRRAVVGVVYNPLLNERYTAVRGGGAYLNGTQRLRVSEASGGQLSQAVVSTNIGYGRGPEVTAFMLANLRGMLERNVRGMRMTGSAATLMCDVALGRLDAYWEWGVHAWDVAAASVVVEEAGGVCCSPTRGASSVDDPSFDLTARSMLCGSRALVESMWPILDKSWSAEWK